MFFGEPFLYKNKIRWIIALKYLQTSTGKLPNMFYGNSYYKIWLLWNNSKNISTVALQASVSNFTKNRNSFMKNPLCEKYRNIGFLWSVFSCIWTIFYTFFDLYFPLSVSSLIWLDFPGPFKTKIWQGYDSVHIPENRDQRKPVCWYNLCTTFLWRIFIMIWAKTLLEISRNSTNLLLLHSYSWNNIRQY